MSGSTRRRRRPLSGVILVSALALLLPLPVLGARSFDAAAPSLPGSTGTAKTFVQETDVAIVDNSTVESTLAVSGLGRYLWDVDLMTSITHTFAGDLNITLTAPNGRVTTISTDNGSANDNVFNGTLWDDQAATPATDAVYVNNVASSPLAPEGALSRMRGVNPNGTWKLTITDDAGGDIGLLSRWVLRITTFSSEPYTVLTQLSDGTDVPIPDGGAITRSLSVSGVDKAIVDVDLRTHVLHDISSELDITLTSPSGTTVVITTDNGGAFDHVFNGTVWNDQSATPVTDTTYADNVVATPLQPEGALAAFNGEDPNGSWVLRIADDDALLNVGSLDAWRLSIRTGSVQSCDGKQATLVRFSSGTVSGTAGDDVIAVRNGTYTIDGKGGDDTICAGGGDDTISGGNGDDRIFGGTGDDTIRGGDGTDQLYGGGGADSLIGSAGGSDLCVGGGGSDSLSSTCETRRQ